MGFLKCFFYCFIGLETVKFQILPLLSRNLHQFKLGMKKTGHTKAKSSNAMIENKQTIEKIFWQWEEWQGEVETPNEDIFLLASDMFYNYCHLAFIKSNKAIKGSREEDFRG